MKSLSKTTKAYIYSTILLGSGLIAWSLFSLDWTKSGLYILAALGAAAQTLKVEGPNNRTNYSIAWFVYGLAIIALGPAAALFVVVVSHLVEWAWHKYPWYIQAFNIGNHVISAFLAGLVLTLFKAGNRPLDLNTALSIAFANIVFVFLNHYLVGWVVRLARGMSFAESGVFEFLTLSLDFATLSLGTATALAWAYDPFAGLLTSLPLILLYQALRLPALVRRLKEGNAV
jgi:hypothetical protein